MYYPEKQVFTIENQVKFGIIEPYVQFSRIRLPTVTLNILVINDFVTTPNINMDIWMNDSVIPNFIEPIQFETSSLTPSVHPFERYIK